MNPFYAKLKNFYVASVIVFSKMIKILFYFLGIVVTMLSPLLGDNIAVFEKPQRDARVLIANKKLFKETGKQFRQIINNHPLAYVHHFYEVKGPSNLVGYYRPDVVVKSDGKSLIRVASISIIKTILSISISVVLLYLIYNIFTKDNSDVKFLFIPILLRILLLLITFTYLDNIIVAASDDIGYFQTMKDILDGNWTNQWHFTVGLGFLYLPFILFFKAKEFYDIVPYFNYFSCFILSPGAIALGYLILRKLNVSQVKALVVMTIWSIYPFISFHLENMDKYNFQQYFNFPPWCGIFNDFEFYGFCINAGFNAMSDTPGLFVILLIIYLLLQLPNKLHSAIIIGSLYGFACLIRINYIIVSPLIAFLLYYKYNDSVKSLLKASFLSVLAFVIVFGIQFVFNQIQFGSPFTFGYVLHYVENNVLDRPISGFTFHTLFKFVSTKFLMNVNLPIFALGTAALWVIKDKYKQAILTLLSVPLVVFFCGYSHTFCDPRRFVFLSFVGFLMAIVTTEIWDKLKLKEKAIISLELFIMVMFTVPFSANWIYLPFKLGPSYLLSISSYLVLAFIIPTIGYLFYTQKKEAGIFLFLSIIFFYVHFSVLTIGMFLLLVYVPFRYIYENRKYLYRKLFIHSKR